MEKNERKQCPKCGLICGINAEKCPQCQYEFPVDSGQSEQSAADNPKAPKKTCPECGARVYISRTRCDVCNHKFVSKREEELLKEQETARSETSNTKKSKASRPAKAIRNLSIALVAYGILIVVIMAVLIRYVPPVWFAIISTGSAVISLAVGIGFGVGFDSSYGKASMRPFNIYCVIVIIGMALVDILYLTKGIQAYSGSLKWGMGAIAVSISVAVITSLLAMRGQLKENYCSYCDLTDALRFSHEQNEKEIYGYKFETRKGHTETARISSDRYGDSDTYIQYKTPDYQENLGLHKTTVKEKVYVCEKCGRTVVRNSSVTEKVDM